MKYRYISEGYFDTIDKSKNTKISVEDTKTKIKSSRIKNSAEEIKNILSDANRNNILIITSPSSTSPFNVRGQLRFRNAYTLNYSDYISRFISFLQSSSHINSFFSNSDHAYILATVDPFDQTVSDNNVIFMVDYRQLSNITYYFKNINKMSNLFINYIDNNDIPININLTSDALNIEINYVFNITDEFYNKDTPIVRKYMSNSSTGLYKTAMRKQSVEPGTIEYNIQNSHITYDDWYGFLTGLTAKDFKDVYHKVFATDDFISRVQSNIRILSESMSVQPIFENMGLPSIPVNITMSFYADCNIPTAFDDSDPMEEDYDGFENYIHLLTVTADNFKRH